MKKLLVTALITLAAFTYGCNSSASASESTPTDDPAVKELQQKMSSLEGTINTLNGTINTQAGTISTLTNRIASLEAAVPGSGSGTIQATFYVDGGIMHCARDSYQCKALDTGATLYMTEVGVASKPLAQDWTLKTTVVSSGDLTLLQIWLGSQTIDEGIYSYSYGVAAYAAVPTSVYSDAMKTKLIKEIARYSKGMFYDQTVERKNSYLYIAPVSM